MAQSLVALFAVLVMTGMSLRANSRYANESRLPMQWLLPDTVVRTASRRAALAFTPLLATASLIPTVAVTLLLEPRPGQGGLVIPAVAAVALVFVAVHALHLALIARTLRGDAGK